jgi:hypothetical protein
MTFLEAVKKTFYGHKIFVCDEHHSWNPEGKYLQLKNDCLVGPDGNTIKMHPVEYLSNWDIVENKKEEVC